MKKYESTRFAWALASTLLVTALAAAGPRERCDGRMTGGGSVFDNEQGEVSIDGNRVTHGFELHCDATRNPNNLQINWKDAQSNQHHFHLTALLSAVCSDSPLIAPEPPVAFFDTYVATGEGKYDGVAGAYAEWTFTDAGEGGSGDTATIRVWDPDGNLVLDVSGFLTFGNHQAHNT